MSAFPSYAKVLLGGFSQKSDFSVLRSEMDGGLAKQRPRRSKPIVTRAISILVTRLADQQAFDQWVAVDLSGGTAWFDWVDPLDRKTKQARFVDGDITWSSPGIVWTAQAKIETLG